MKSEPRRGLFTGLFEAGSITIDDDTWLQAMLDTEAALARAAERAGLALPGSGAAVTSIAKISFMDNASLGVSAAAAGNPIPALVKALTGLVPSGAAQAIHLGATSQDIIDTAAMLLARQAIDATRAELAAAAESCAALTREHASTLMSGRTLLQQAVPITFGLVTAGWLVALDEAREQLRCSRARLAIQYGGAAGTLASLGSKGPEVARLLGEELDLAVPVLPWHTNRLRVLEIAAALTAANAALGKIARDVTLLSQTEVGEVQDQPRAALRPCRTSRIRSPRSSFWVTRNKLRICMPAWPPPPNRNCNEPPGPGTPNGSRSRACFPSRRQLPAGRLASYPACGSMPREWKSTWG